MKDTVEVNGVEVYTKDRSDCTRQALHELYVAWIEDAVCMAKAGLALSVISTGICVGIIAWLLLR